jgi:hypothetical protein
MTAKCPRGNNCGDPISCADADLCFALKPDGTPFAEPEPILTTERFMELIRKLEKKIEENDQTIEHLLSCNERMHREATELRDLVIMARMIGVLS